MFTSPQEVLDFIKNEEVVFVDIRFTDMPGVQQHFNLPAKAIDDDFFVNGQLFDGSSIRGFQGIAESDMQLIPDVQSAYVDPFRIEKTLVIICSIVNPRTGEPYHRDPRGVAERAEAYLQSTGIADTAFFASEAEFFVFEDVRYQVEPNSVFFKIDSDEAPWNTGRKEEGGNLGNKTPVKGGYFPVSPVDKQADLRDAMCVAMDQVGLEVERSHHEVGSPGQAEINYKFSTLTNAADDLLKFKYVIKNSALEFGHSATFMPKPFTKYAGSGMHTHFSLFEGDTNAFFEAGAEYQLSKTARHFIAGVLKHAPEFTAVTNQFINSYKRLWGGGEAPSYVSWGHNNRSALVRVPLYKPNKMQSARIEYRGLDSASNPYLAYAVILAAGLKGIENEYPLMPAVTEDLAAMTNAERRAMGYNPLPASLREAINITEESEFMAEVLGEQVFEQFLRNKRADWDQYQAQVTPYELKNNLGIL